MKLRRVEINGFKSFGKRTILDFPEGISAIVGPNGSGKSNIIDAICFGLGYPSRNLRAAKAQELIHSGKAGNVPEAKVSLILKTSGAAEGPDQVMEIKRKVDRSGRSTYKLNTVTTSLEDLHDTLGKHSIPKDGFNIVMQNDVMRFIEVKPKERREILDQISGISGYEEKKKKALEELQIVERRISDTNLILSEKKGYLEQIGKDREIAVKYQSMHDELKRSKSIYLYSAVYDIESAMRQIGERDSAVNKEKELKIVELARIDEEIEGVQKKLEEMTQRMLRGTTGETGKLKGEMGSLKSAVEKEQEKIQFIKGEIETLEQKKKGNAATQKELKASIKENEDAIKRLKGDIEKVQKAIDAKEKERETKTRDFDNSELTALEKERKVASESVFEARKALMIVEKELDIANKKERELKETLGQKKGSLKLLESQLTDMDKNLTKLGAEAERVEKLVAELDAAEKRLSELFPEYARVESEIKTIERIEAKIGESESLKFVLANKDKGYVGRVSELGSAPEKYKIALEVAAGDKSKCLVVSDDKAAQFYIEGLRKDKIGRATFLPMNKVHGPELRPIKGDGVFGFARDLIKCDAKYQKVFDYVFAETIVVKDLDTARRIGIGTIKMVTLEGDFLSAGGAMTGGFYQKAALTFSSTADKKKQLEGIKREIEEQKAKKDRLEKELEGKDRINIGVMREKRLNINEKLDTMRGDMAALEKQLAELEPHKADLAKKKSASAKDIEVLEKALAGIESRMSMGAFAELKSIMQTIDAAVHELKDQKFAVQTRENGLKADIENMLSKIRDIDAQTAEAEKAISKFKNNVQESISQIMESGKKLSELEEKHSLASAESQKHFKEQERLSQIVKEMGERRGGLEAVVEKLKNEANEIEIKKAKNGAKLEEIRAQMEGVEAPKKEDLKGADIPKLRRRVKELEEELAKIQGVNLKAVEMYDELEKQYKEIDERNRKLAQEKEKIYDLIETIEEKKKTIFYESFYKVKEHFEEIISELFVSEPKTVGILSLENESDPFNSGLILKVKPRGREGLNIDSLSGGEKTLTAIAFLMATQSVTPSPFYILDEVDAALDQENVLRLVHFLKNRKKSQFILISHNPETVKHMDSVIGVHMQNGISQIVGVNMESIAE